MDLKLSVISCAVGILEPFDDRDAQRVAECITIQLASYIKIDNRTGSGRAELRGAQAKSKGAWRGVARRGVAWRGGSGP